MSATSLTKKSSRVPGAKILITASALAATFAGWASLAWKTSTDSAAISPSLLSAEAQLAAAGVALQPIPTLVPGPSLLSLAANSAQSQGGSQRALRSVSALPSPVTLTQSSRP